MYPKVTFPSSRSAKTNHSNAHRTDASGRSRTGDGPVLTGAPSPGRMEVDGHSRTQHARCGLVGFCLLAVKHVPNPQCTHSPAGHTEAWRGATVAQWVRAAFLPPGDVWGGEGKETRSSLGGLPIPGRRQGRGWKNWGVRTGGSISSFVLTQTLTLGESLAYSTRLENNSPNKSVPAPNPHYRGADGTRGGWLCEK